MNLKERKQEYMEGFGIGKGKEKIVIISEYQA